jgi:hypothetical protein
MASSFGNFGSCETNDHCCLDPGCDLHGFCATIDEAAAQCAAPECEAVP